MPAPRLPAHLSPMLAMTWHKAPAAAHRGPFLVSPKLDGIRCVATRDGFFSRNHNRFFELGHIAAALAPLFDRDPSLVLDGELYSHGLAHESGNYERILAAVSRLRSKAGAKGTAPLVRGLGFHAFDVIEMNQGGKAGLPPVTANQTPFLLRHKALKALEEAGGFAGEDSYRAAVRPAPPTTETTTKKRSKGEADRKARDANLTLLQSEPVVIVPHTLAADEAAVFASLKNAFGRNFEGVVARSCANVYTPGGRVQSMLKVVPWVDSEFPIAGFVRKNGKLVALEMVTPEGQPFKAILGVADSVSQSWLDQGDTAIGQLATVRYPSKTSRGVPRFGVVKCIRGQAGRTM